MTVAAWLGMMMVLGGEPLPTCSDPVIGAFEAGRHVEAARSAETCWATSRDLRVLLFAAQAREGAGHASHAVRLYQQYLERAPATASERAGAEARLQGLMTRVVSMAVEAPEGELTLLLVGRPDVLRIEWRGQNGVVHLEPGTWRLLARDGIVRTFELPGTERLVIGKDRPTGTNAPPEVLPLPLVVSVRPATATGPGAQLELLPETGPAIVVPVERTTTQVSVAPGPWRVTLRAPGREAVERRVRVQAPMRVELAPRLDRVTRARIGLGIGLGAASLGLGAWGARWVAMGRGRAFGSFLEGGVYQVDEALQSYALWMDGSAVLAAGGGALGVAVTNVVAVRRLPLAIETGVGAGLAIAGAIWRGVERRELMERSSAIRPSPDLTEYGQLLYTHRPREMAASVMFGLGLGMAAAGGVSLVTRLAVGRGPEPVRRLEPIGGPTYLGIRGRF